MILSREEHERRLRQVIIPPQLSIERAIPVLDRAGLGILLLCGERRRLVGVVTDGDIRRAILRSIPFREPCLSIASRHPVTELPGVSVSRALALMDHHHGASVNHLPLVDARGRMVGLLVRRDLSLHDRLELSAVVMAGGYGIRLRPLTRVVPKPMLPVGKRPLLELIIEQLRDAGVRRINLTTHYKQDVIRRHFGDGRGFGVKIRYVQEDRPLGTAGVLSRLPASREPLLVVNGDIMTTVDFRAMVHFHQEQRAQMTVAVRPHEWRIQFGVVETEGVRIKGIQEKPLVRHFINAGIYLLNPEVCRYIPSRKPYEMPMLIRRLISSGQRVVSFPVREYWADVGRPADYGQVQEDMRLGKLRS